MIYRKHLTPDELELHVERTHEIWGGSEPLTERKRSLFEWTERAGDSLFLSGLFDRDGTLLCSLKRYRIKLRIQERETQAVGIGSVFTEVSRRGHGYASRLLTRVMEESREEQGCEAALLYSDIGVALYHRLGFQESPARQWEISLGELTSDAAPLAFRLAVPDDIGLLMRLHREATADAPLATLRDPLGWRLFRAINHIDRDLILLQGAQPVGYLSVSTDRQRNALFVDEVCAASARPAEIWATMRALVAERGLAGARGWCSTRQIPPGSRESDRTRAVPMLASLVEWLKPEPATLRNAYYAPVDHF